MWRHPDSRSQKERHYSRSFWERHYSGPPTASTADEPRSHDEETSQSPGQTTEAAHP
jgi:hypothetical protein